PRAARGMTTESPHQAPCWARPRATDEPAAAPTRRRRRPRAAPRRRPPMARPAPVGPLGAPAPGRAAARPQEPRDGADVAADVRGVLGRTGAPDLPDPRRGVRHRLLALTPSEGCCGPRPVYLAVP